MPHVDAVGNIQLDKSDIIPREVARRDDDTPEIIALIDSLNPTIKTAEDLALAVEKVDDLRRKVSHSNNPFIAKPV